MRNEYNYLKKEELLKNPKISLKVLENDDEIFEAMAKEMIDEIKRKNSLGEKTVFICPVGPVGQYSYFVDRVNKENISLKNVWFINMDEYLTDDKKWISKEDSLSFRGYMDYKVYSKINQELIMPEEQRIFPDPDNLEYIPKLINEIGGVDICFGGIGLNGHIAFNEPNENFTTKEFLNQKTRVCSIAQETRTTNSIAALNGALSDMPKYCVTVGMDEIFNSKKIRLACFRDWHRAVVRRGAYDEVSTEFPVTLLQNHKDACISLTEFVANLPEN